MEHINLEDKCGYYNASRSQRKNEIKRGLGKKGTMSFENMGCYKCNGDNRKCDAYYNPKEEYERGFNNEM